MNKKLLGLLMLPTLALASCSGGFKKVKYFKAGGDEYITEKGAKVQYVLLATYELEATDVATVRAKYTNFPASFTFFVDQWQVDPAAPTINTFDRKAAPTIDVPVADDFYTLKLVANTEVVTKSYAEYAYKASERSLKITNHNYEGLAGATNVFVGAVQVDKKPTAELIPVAEADYEIYGYMSVVPEVVERTITFGNDINITVAFE